MSWNTLMNINYELAGKIIVKSFLNTLLWNLERIECLEKFREYLPVFPERLEVKIDEVVYMSNSIILLSILYRDTMHFHSIKNELKIKLELKIILVNLIL